MLSISPTISATTAAFLKLGNEVSLAKVKGEKEENEILATQVNNLPKSDTLTSIGFVQTDGVTHLSNKVKYIDKDGKEKEANQLQTSIMWDSVGEPVRAVEKRELKKAVKYEDKSLSELRDTYGLEKGLDRNILMDIAKHILLVPNEKTKAAYDNNPRASFYAPEIQYAITVKKDRKTGKPTISKIENSDDATTRVIETLNLMLSNEAYITKEKLDAYITKIDFEKRKFRASPEVQAKAATQIDAIKEMVASRQIDTDLTKWSYVPFNLRTFSMLEGYDEKEELSSAFKREQQRVVSYINGELKANDKTYSMSETTVGGITFAYSTKLDTLVTLNNSRFTNGKSYDTFKAFRNESEAMVFEKSIDGLRSKVSKTKAIEKQAAEKELAGKYEELRVWAVEQEYIPADYSINSNSMEKYTRYKMTMAKIVTSELEEAKVSTRELLMGVGKRDDGRLEENYKSKGYPYGLSFALNSGLAKVAIETVLRTYAMTKSFGKKDDNGDLVIELKERSVYTPVAAISRGSYKSFPFTRELSEKIAISIQRLNKIDEKGEYSYKKTNFETGEVTDMKAVVDIEETLAYLGKVLGETVKKERGGPTMIGAAKVLDGEFAQASLLDGADRVSAIKDIIANKDAVYRELITSALVTNTGELNKTLERIYAAKKFPNVADQMAIQVSDGFKSGKLLDETTYQRFDNPGTKEEQSRNFVNISNIYMSIVKAHKMLEAGVTKLAPRGAATDYCKELIAKAKNSGEKDISPMIMASLSPEVQEVNYAVSILSMISNNKVGRNQRYFVPSPKEVPYQKKMKVIDKEGREKNKSFMLAPTEIEGVLEKNAKSFTETSAIISAFVDEVRSARKENSSTAVVSEEDLLASLMGELPSNTEDEKTVVETNEVATTTTTATTAPASITPTKEQIAEIEKEEKEEEVVNTFISEDNRVDELEIFNDNIDIFGEDDEEDIGQDGHDALDLINAPLPK